MPKKWVHGGINPEGTSFALEVDVPRIKKTKDGIPEPPPNFLPQDKVKTFDQNNPPILSGAQGYSQAIEKKEE